MRILLRISTVLFFAAAALAQSPAPKTWRIRLSDGNATPLTVTYSGRTIDFRDSTGLAYFSIPPGSITDIFYSPQNIRRSSVVYDFMRRHCCGGTGSEALPVLAWAITSPIGSARDHFVEIYWHFHSVARFPTMARTARLCVDGIRSSRTDPHIWQRMPDVGHRSTGPCSISIEQPAPPRQSPPGIEAALKRR